MKEKNAQHIAGQIGRISFYEDLLTQAEQALAGEPSSESTAPEEADLAEKIRKLDSYYGSPEWRADFEADEAGAFGDLKRGVLSEDAVYDLITEHSELMERLIRAAEYGKSADARSAAAAGSASGHGADEEGQLYE